MYAWLKMNSAKRKRKSKAKAKIVDRSQSNDMSESTMNSQVHETSASKAEEFTKKKLNSRTVSFSLSQTRVVHFDAAISCHNLVWYKSADLKQFKEDAIKDASKIKHKEHKENGEKICWWGLERLVEAKTMRVRQQVVKQLVLHKQGEAHQDEQYKEASEWAATVAQKKAAYYSSHIELRCRSIRVGSYTVAQERTA